MISIYGELRNLEEREFLYCLHSIKDMAEDCSFCTPCYGKGLVYMKCLTIGMHEDENREATRKYENFVLSVGVGIDYERDLIERAALYGVKI